MMDNQNNLLNLCRDHLSRLGKVNRQLRVDGFPLGSFIQQNSILTVRALEIVPNLDIRVKLGLLFNQLNHILGLFGCGEVLDESVKAAAGSGGK
jgi:hypothetical protein